MSSFVRGEAVTGFPFTLRHSQTGAAITSGTVTGYVTLDGGTQTALAGTPVHEGLGQWSIDLAATETDGDLLGLLFVHADGFASFTVETSSSPETSLTVGSPGEVEICNLALVEGLGAQPITSLDDDSNAAKSCKRLYPSAGTSSSWISVPRSPSPGRSSRNWPRRPCMTSRTATSCQPTASSRWTRTTPVRRGGRSRIR